jgi:hypothetical protein
VTRIPCCDSATAATMKANPMITISPLPDFLFIYFFLIFLLSNSSNLEGEAHDQYTATVRHFCFFENTGDGSADKQGNTRLL